MKHKLILPLVVLLPTVGLVACGGSGSGDGSTSGSRTVGVVSSVDGSNVTVGGTSFNAASANVTGDVSSNSPDAIDPGMVVVVDGPVDDSSNHGTANHIDYDAEVEGKVVSNGCMTNPVPCTMDVVGQTVQVNDTTHFKSEMSGMIDSIAMIPEGARVEVSGYSDGNGNIVATYIKVEDDQMEDGDDMEVEGIIANLDATAGTFEIGGQVIHYDPSAINLTLENGMNVEVYFREEMGQMIAIDIELEDDYGDDDDGEIEIEGMVTSDGVADDGTFSVNGQMVMLSDNVKYEDGMTQDAIVNGAMIEVEGYMQDGMLIVTEVGSEDSEDDGMDDSSSNDSSTTPVV
ncbi:MAG: DUF5666 domain-containing protein [Gammaproteobacteria bacterium]|jgi:hypothetical protein